MALVKFIGTAAFVMVLGAVGTGIAMRIPGVNTALFPSAAPAS